MVTNSFFIKSDNLGKVDENVKYILAPDFTKLDYMDEQSIDTFYQSAEAHLKNLEELVFELNYYGKFSISDIENMGYFKMKRWYSMLYDKKEKEFKKSQELNNQ